MAWPWNRGSAKPTPKPTQFMGLGGYEASRMARRLRGWVADTRTINALLASGGEPLRARARQLCRENPYAANACEAFVSAAVGPGIKPSSLIDDKDQRRQIQTAFLRWTDEADADGLTDFYGLQALAARAMFEAGECFIRFRARLPQDGLTVPLQLQLLESEMLPFNDNTTLPNGNIVRNGIEFDSIGRRVNYRFLRNHPGDIPNPGTYGQITVVPAAEVMHLYRPLRPGQVRGQPGITPGMVRLYLIDQYDDAELDRKRTAAMFAGFIKKPAADDLDPVSGQDAGDSQAVGLSYSPEVAVTGLEPGTLQVLADGEDITFSNPVEVGGSYEAFQYRNLLAASSAVGLPYHSITSDVSKASYASTRIAELEKRRRMDQFQWMTLIFQLCRPVWRRWFVLAVTAGAIPVTARDLARDPSLADVKWIPPRWDWVDPLKDRQAQALAEDRGWISRSDNIEGEGFDPEETDARIAADREREAELGLSFPLTPPGAQKVTESPEPAEPTTAVAA